MVKNAKDHYDKKEYSLTISIIKETRKNVEKKVYQLLMDSIESARLDTLRGAALDEQHGQIAWDALGEALPTAIAQGVAHGRFEGKTWSRSRPWYHLEEIDAYAKRLFDLLERTLANGGTFDEAFVRSAVKLYSAR